MKNKHRKQLNKLFAVVISAIVVACASPGFDQSAEPVYTPGQGSELPPGTPVATGEATGADGAYSDDEQLEEVVVTGARVTNRSYRHRAERREPVRSAGIDYADAKTDYERQRRRQLGIDKDGADPLARVVPGEEVWIIAKTGDAAGDAERPGTGSMLTLVSDGPDLPPVRVPLPLKHTAVSANIDGYIGSVNVRQSFENPYSTKIEAVYVFPLPEKAAVTEFVMVIGERRIRGILREKEEAKAIYAEARRQGFQASLLLQQRPNIFQQKVANIEPGKSIDIDIRYFHSVPYVDGWYSFVFPTVVGPRFNPPGSNDPVEALPRGSNPGATKAVTYLSPGERSGHDISIDVRIDAGVSIENLRSTHEIVTSDAAPGVITVSLADEAVIPNRDFVLDFKVAGDTLRSNLLTWQDPDSGQGYFSMMLYPPATVDDLERVPMEMVFVIDCSGSMRGKPMRQAKSAILRALDQLRPGDTFQVIRFSSNASQLGEAPLPATRENLALARDYVRGLSDGGGTMMVEGVKAALAFPHDPERLRVVTFLTDGYIGNEEDVIRAVHDNVGAARVFSFGVGNSVNRYLMERMAKTGRGAVAYLGLEDSGSEIMDAFFDRVSRPALSDLSIEWGGMAVSSVYPSTLPDLFVGRPVFVTGTFDGKPGPVLVSGLAGGRTEQFVVDGHRPGQPNLAKLWARLRIGDYMDRRAWQPDPHNQLGNAIRETALEYQLMSDYTAFVAVDASRVTEGTHGVSVQQAVPVPEGVRYETTVTEGSR